MKSVKKTFLNALVSLGIFLIGFSADAEYFCSALLSSMYWSGQLIESSEQKSIYKLGSGSFGSVVRIINHQTDQVHLEKIYHYHVHAQHDYKALQFLYFFLKEKGIKGVNIVRPYDLNAERYSMTDLRGFILHNPYRQGLTNGALEEGSLVQRIQLDRYEKWRDLVESSLLSSGAFKKGYFLHIPTNEGVLKIKFNPWNILYSTKDGQLHLIDPR